MIEEGEGEEEEDLKERKSFRNLEREREKIHSFVPQNRHGLYMVSL